MQMRLQRLIQTQAQKRRRANKMANENPVAQSGKQAIGSWLKSKGTAIGVAVGDTGLIAFCIGLVKQAIAFF